MHCAAQRGLSVARACDRCHTTIVALTIVIAIVVINMMLSQTLLVTKILSVSVMQDEALHGRSQLPLGPRYLRKSLGPRSSDGSRWEEEGGN